MCLPCLLAPCSFLLGGGQLGRMLAASASLLNIKVVILDEGHYGPAKQVVSPSESRLDHVDGSFNDPAKIRELASKVDVLTVEIEHVDVSCLEDLEANSHVAIHPSPSTIRIIQDKFIQKEHLLDHGAPISEFMEIDSTVESVRMAAERLGVPLMLKSRTFAYDGRGNFPLHDPARAEEALVALAGRPLYAEKWVSFVKEVAVIVVRTSAGDVLSYPAVETVHKENICHLVFAPLRDRNLSGRAQAVAESAVKHFKGAGVFGVHLPPVPHGADHRPLLHGARPHHRSRDRADI